jgi:hypothetical protein
MTCAHPIESKRTQSQVSKAIQFSLLLNFWNAGQYHRKRCMPMLYRHLLAMTSTNLSRLPMLSNNISQGSQAKKLPFLSLLGRCQISLPYGHISNSPRIPCSQITAPTFTCWLYSRRFSSRDPHALQFAGTRLVQRHSFLVLLSSPLYHEMVRSPVDEVQKVLVLSLAP